MAGQQGNIRNFIVPHRGPGRSAASLLEDLVLFDPFQSVRPGYHLLEDGARSFAEGDFIGELLPEGSCLHEFCLKKRQSTPPSIDESPTPDTVWQVAAICHKCRIHLLLKVNYTVAWQDGPCPTDEDPMHHLVRSTWRQDAAYRDLKRDDANNTDELHVYECSSLKCSAIVTVHLTPPMIPPDALHVLLDKKLLSKRTEAAFELKQGHTEGMKRPSPLDVLSDLRAYLRNAWRKDGQTEISLDNKRFVVRFGPEGKACGEVLEMLGFEFIPDKSWRVPQPDIKESLPLQQPENIALDNIENELDALIANRPAEEQAAAQDTTKLESALFELSRVLSCQNYDKDPASRTARRSILYRPRAATVLGIPEDVSDDLVIWAYRRQMALENDDPKQTAKLMTALEEVQRQRQSEKLSSQVAIERSLGRYGEQTISDSFRSLGLSANADCDDNFIIGTFESRLSDAPMQEPQMRESLAVIGLYRQSPRIVDYARNTITTYEDALRFFDVPADTDDSYFPSLYIAKVNDHASVREMAQKAVQIVAEHRSSESLKKWAASGYQGDLQESKMDVGEAFTVLGVEDRTEEDPELLYTLFTVRSEDEPGNRVRYRKAIEIIAEATNNLKLKDMLQMPVGQQMVQPKVSLDEPIGLDNIGNTCYLNSLLQSLFTVLSIRNIVLDFEQYKQKRGAENMKDKRVGQRLISEQEVKSAQNFVAQLAELFRQMISSPSSTIRPAQELARLTLEIKQTQDARRRSTMQSQRRATLGTIDSKPVHGPLPESVIESDAVQPLQSPEAIEVSDPVQAAPSKASNNDIVNANAKQLVKDEDTTSDATLVPRDGPDQPTMVTGKDENKNYELHTEPLNTAQVNGVKDVPMPDLIDVEGPQSSARNTTGYRSRTMSLEPLVEKPPPDTNGNEQSGMLPSDDYATPAAPAVSKETSMIYSPPPGKPPPVPPRPLPTSTLEQWARQNDVTEVLGHAVFQLSCAIRPRGFQKSGEQQDEIHDTFYGEEQTQILRGTASPQPPVQFLIMTVQISNEPKDLYAALDNYFDVAERGDGSDVYGSITKLPPVLCLGFGRVYNDGTNQYKINCHVDLPTTLFMDRYTNASKGSSLLERRKQTWEYKKKLRQHQARLDQIEPKGKPPIDEDLNTALAAIRQVTEAGAAENMGNLSFDPEGYNTISHYAQTVREERRVQKIRIAELEQQIKDSFTDAAFRKEEYRLHAAFFHRGTVGSGHYWVYIYDHVNEIWRKYNDDHVTHVTNLKEIFGDPRNDRSNPNWSSYNPANPYFMIYVRSDQIKSTGSGEDGIVETVKRAPVIPAVREDEGNVEGDDTNATMDLRPLGSDTPNTYETNSSHHEFADQPSQMSYMPPDVPRLQGQEPPSQHQEYANIGAVMSSQRPSQGQRDESWEEEQMRQAIERSLQTEAKGHMKKEGEWDDSENMDVEPNQW